MVKDVKLKVAEARQDDVNRAVVRIDTPFMKVLGVNVGDIVVVKGEKDTLAIVDRAYPSDLGLEIVRMDSVTRKNAKVSIGENVKLSKPDQVLDVQKVVLAPLQEVELPTEVLEQILRKEMLKRPVCTENIITIKYTERKVSFSNDNSFQSLLGQSFFGFNFNSLRFKIISVKGIGVMGSATVIEFANASDENSLMGVTYEDIGGLKSQLSKVRELVELPLKHPEIFARLGVDAPKGILLYGPPGTGKTLLARVIANETEASFTSISAPEIVQKFYGESEKKLRELFEKAKKTSPAIIFIDEIDAIAAKREEVQGETEKRIVAQLLTLMDGLNKNKKIIVIAATNRPDVLDEALRRPGRFDREIEIGVPKEEDRLEILKIHTRVMPFACPDQFKYYESYLQALAKKQDGVNIEKIKDLFKKDKYEALLAIPEDIVEKVRKKESDKILQDIARITHGFVGADLEALTKEAAFNVLRRSFPDMNFKQNEELSTEVLSKLEITSQDFVESLKIVRPSAMREFLVEIPQVRWDDVGGLENLKSQLVEMIEWPLKNPIALKRLGITAPKGILLYGPPGTGKTLLAKAVANETSSNFIYIKSPEIIQKFIGDSEKTIRKIFQKARQNSPCILFFDEFDAVAATRLGGERGRTMDTIVTQILTELDGLEDLVNVKVLAATNRPTLIDPALLRPGRFDKLVFVDIPNKASREKILEIHLRNTPVDKKSDLIVDLAEKTEGYVGADLEALIREAGLIALRRDIKSEKIETADFHSALEVVRPSVPHDLKKMYEEVEADLKRPRKPEQELSMNSYM